jgi:hypothetical protein
MSSSNSSQTSGEHRRFAAGDLDVKLILCRLAESAFTLW